MRKRMSGYVCLVARFRALFTQVFGCHLVAVTGLWVGGLGFLEASLDLNGDGMSDLWVVEYDGGSLDPSVDTDGDGQTNREESVLGSDPRDADSYFALKNYFFNEETSLLTLDIHTIPGNRYVIESSQSLTYQEGWRPDKAFYTSSGGSLVFECSVAPYEKDRRFYRVRQQIDEDSDGLTSFEEKVLGLDDRDFSSADPAGGGDLAWVVDQILSGKSLALESGKILQGQPRSVEEVSRFLNQATFGPDMEMITELHQSNLSYGDWIDQQLAMPATTISDSMAEEMNLGADDNNFLFRQGWWRSAATGEDQLRQRMAFALSEILVVSGQGSDLIRGSSVAAGTYYDLLVEGAFGDYSDLLLDVTYSPAMGLYLGHLRNMKADPERGLFPDENYARELMQLFSIGLWELNEDGSHSLDRFGRSIPTYTNFHITELAKVMTGFNWGASTGYLQWEFSPGMPMSIWNVSHEDGEKYLVNGGYIPAGLSAEEDVSRAVEHLGNHANVGPFIGKQLIQRFVTSNPSPEYIERVSRAFRSKEKGGGGDLAAVVRAILLDPEARREDVRQLPTYGKMREPFITYVHLVRAFNATNEAGSFPINTTDGIEELGQIPGHAPSVFNFFSPDYSVDELPNGELLLAPEFQILTPLRVVGWDNLIRRGIELGIDPYRMSQEESVLHHDYEIELGLTDQVEELIDRLDLIFTYGSLSEEQRQIIRTVFAENPGLSRERKLWIAIYLVMSSPEYVILR